MDFKMLGDTELHDNSVVTNEIHKQTANVAGNPLLKAGFINFCTVGIKMTPCNSDTITKRQIYGLKHLFDSRY